MTGCSAMSYDKHVGEVFSGMPPSKATDIMVASVRHAVDRTLLAATSI
jgi:hypothetical protein